MVLKKGCLMAKLKGGILGTVSGKVSGVVAGQWKNKNYVRQYAVPSNPNTSAQQVQRGLFGGAVAFGKQLVGQVFNVFVDPFQKAMSGFNYFIKQNITYFTASPAWSSIKITFGKLYMEASVSDPSDGSETTTIPFATTLGANGLAADMVRAVVYREDDGKVWFNTTGVARSTGSITVSLPGAVADDAMRYYLWAAQYDAGGKLVLVSDSVSSGWTFTP